MGIEREINAVDSIKKTINEQDSNIIEKKYKGNLSKIKTEEAKDKENDFQQLSQLEKNVDNSYMSRRDKIREFSKAFRGETPSKNINNKNKKNKKTNWQKIKNLFG